MEHEKIERINELTRLSRERVLENVRLKRSDGTLEPLKKKEDKH